MENFPDPCKNSWRNPIEDFTGRITEGFPAKSPSVTPDKIA